MSMASTDASTPAAGVVFVVGCGRSGTTLVYDLITGHPDTAWISNYSDRWPPAAIVARRWIRPVVSAVDRAIPRPVAVRPVEGYDTWDRAVGGGRDGELTKADLTSAEATAMHQMVASHIRLSGASLFVNKNTRNTRRVGYLAAAFPGARWVHVVRDPRAVARSLDRVAFWPSSPAWWRGAAMVRDEIAAGQDSFTLGAECWTAEVSAAGRGLAAVAPEHQIEVRYEDLVADPGAELRRLASFLDIDPMPLLSAADKRGIDDRTAVALQDLDERSLEIVRDRCADVARGYGFEL